MLAFAAVAEAATGLVLLVYPLIVVRLLFGAEVGGAAIAVCRIAGLSLIALGLACGPGPVRPPGLFGMLFYSSLVALYFVGLGLAGDSVGKLLWPAALVHVVLTILLARELVKELRKPAPETSHSKTGSETGESL